MKPHAIRHAHRPLPTNHVTRADDDGDGDDGENLIHRREELMNGGFWLRHWLVTETSRMSFGEFTFPHEVTEADGPSGKLLSRVLPPGGGVALLFEVKWIFFIQGFLKSDLVQTFRGPQSYNSFISLNRGTVVEVGPMKRFKSRNWIIGVFFIA